jgi:dTMP kinase
MGLARSGKMMYNKEKPADNKPDRSKKAGRLITFEGIDGTGKSTQIARLAAALREAGHDVLELREPGGTAIGEAIRNILLDCKNSGMSIQTELLLFEAARAQLVREIIQPALKAGTWVICDRFYDSTSVYQGFGRGLDLDMIEALNNIAVDGCHPDATLLLDLPVEAAISRLSGRTEKADRLDGESIAFKSSIREGFLKLAARSNGRITVVDAGLPETTQAQLIYQIIKEGLD